MKICLIIFSLITIGIDLSYGQDDLLKKILTHDEEFDEQITCQIKIPKQGTYYNYQTDDKGFTFNTESLFHNLLKPSKFDSESKSSIFNSDMYRITPKYLGLFDRERSLSLSYKYFDVDESLSLSFESVEFGPESTFKDFRSAIDLPDFRERNILSLDYTKNLTDDFYFVGGVQFEHYSNDNPFAGDIDIKGEQKNKDTFGYNRFNDRFFDPNKESESLLKVYGGVGLKKVLKAGDWKCTVGAEVIAGASSEGFEKSEVQFRGGVTFDSQDWGGREVDNPYLIMSLMTDMRTDFDDRHNEMAMFTVGTSMKVKDWLIKPYAGVAVYNERGEDFFGFNDDPYFVLGFSFSKSRR